MWSENQIYFNLQKKAKTKEAKWWIRRLITILSSQWRIYIFRIVSWMSLFAIERGLKQTTKRPAIVSPESAYRQMCNVNDVKAVEIIEHCVQYYTVFNYEHNVHNLRGFQYSFAINSLADILHNVRCITNSPSLTNVQYPQA